MDVDPIKTFNVKSYKKRPKNVLTAGGFVKSSAAHHLKPKDSIKKATTSVSHL